MKKKHPKHVLDLNGNSFSVRAIGEAIEFSCEGVTFKLSASEAIMLASTLQIAYREALGL